MARKSSSPGFAPKVLALNCSLKPSADEEESSTDRLLNQVLAAMKHCGAHPEEVVRAVDYNIKPGVTSNEGADDDWPGLRQRVLGSNILLLGTPIWLGQPSSVCKRVLERMDAFLGETDKQGRMVSFGIVAAVAVVGNEDGAHHVASQLFQALDDVGFTIPAGGSTYWVGEAMQKKNYIDLPKTPPNVAESIQTLARNAVHLAQLLRANPYPGAK